MIANGTSDQHLIWTTGICVSDRLPPRAFHQTLTGQKLPGSLAGTPEARVKTCKQVSLRNGDICTPNHFVIVQDPRDPVKTYVARVREIIQIQASHNALVGRPDAILIQTATSHGTAVYYAMPRVMLTNEWGLVRLEVCTDPPSLYATPDALWKESPMHCQCATQLR